MVTVDSGKLLRAIRAGKVVAGNDIGRPHMMGVHIHIDKGNVAVEATDGHRLLRATWPGEGSLEALVYHKPLEAWLKSHGGEICLEVVGGRLVATTSESRESFLCHDGFPDFDAKRSDLIPNRSEGYTGRDGMRASSVYLGSIGTVAKALGATEVDIQLGKDWKSPARIDMETKDGMKAVLVIMPYLRRE